VAPDSRFRTARQFVNDLQLIAAAKLPDFLRNPSVIQIAAEPLEKLVGTWGLEPQTSTVSILRSLV
jgi:hypothetical protein